MTGLHTSTLSLDDLGVLFYICKDLFRVIYTHIKLFPLPGIILEYWYLTGF